MEHKYFNYSFNVRLMHFGGYLITVICSLALIAYVLNFLINPGGFLSDVGKNLTIMLLIIFSIILVAIVSFQWPNIRVDQNGIEIKFYFWWLRVFWKDIKAIKKNDYIFYKEYAVRVDKLGPIYYLFGLTRVHDFAPCFLISSFLPGHAELVSAIRKHIH